MNTDLVLTIVCPDRPGIVEHFTGIILRHGGNWEESRMARLGGDFAGIAKVTVPDAKAGALADALKAEGRGDTHVFVKTTPRGARAGRALAEFVLRLEGADHEGIVHRVTHQLAARGVNVVSMETGVAPAPVSGTPLFHLDARVQLPPGLALAALKEDLEAIAAELNVSILLDETGVT